MIWFKKSVKDFLNMFFAYKIKVKIKQ